MGWRLRMTSELLLEKIRARDYSYGNAKYWLQSLDFIFTLLNDAIFSINQALVQTHENFDLSMVVSPSCHMLDLLWLSFPRHCSRMRPTRSFSNGHGPGLLPQLPRGSNQPPQGLVAAHLSIWFTVVQLASSIASLPTWSASPASPRSLSQRVRTISS